MHPRRVLCLCLLLFAVRPGSAHIGAPDTYVNATAGPYHLLVSVHPPTAVPGAAQIDIRTTDAIRSIAITAPNPSPLQRFASEQIFTGSAWVASSSVWQLHLHISGALGETDTSIPVPASASTQPASPSILLWSTATVLAACILLLLFRRTRLLAAAAIPILATTLIATFLVARHTQPAPPMQVALLPNGKLQIRLSGNTDDLVPDHNHLMHLFAIRQPQMDVLLHLHPIRVGPGVFEAELPSMAGGAFTLFADVVHPDGTLVTSTVAAGLPVQTGHILQADDSLGIVPALARTLPAAAPGSTSVTLMDGYRMSLDLASALHPRTGQLLHFTLLDPAGHPPAEMQLYMGMTAHAAVVKLDGQPDGPVFAHIHPAGTTPMLGMDTSSAPASQVSFPFGFPTAGLYRIFVQMKRGGVIETTAFDLLVTP
jgi:hypothetical protein